MSSDMGYLIEGGLSEANHDSLQTLNDEIFGGEDSTSALDSFFNTPQPEEIPQNGAIAEVPNPEKTLVDTDAAEIQPPQPAEVMPADHGSSEPTAGSCNVEDPDTVKLTEERRHTVFTVKSLIDAEDVTFSGTENVEMSDVSSPQQKTAEEVPSQTSVVEHAESQPLEVQPQSENGEPVEDPPQTDGQQDHQEAPPHPATSAPVSHDSQNGYERHQPAEIDTRLNPTDSSARDSPASSTTSSQPQQSGSAKDDLKEKLMSRIRPSIPPISQLQAHHPQLAQQFQQQLLQQTQAQQQLLQQTQAQQLLQQAQAQQAQAQQTQAQQVQAQQTQAQQVQAQAQAQAQAQQAQQTQAQIMSVIQGTSFPFQYYQNSQLARPQTAAMYYQQAPGGGYQYAFLPQDYAIMAAQMQIQQAQVQAQAQVAQAQAQAQVHLQTQSPMRQSASASLQRTTRSSQQQGQAQSAAGRTASIVSPAAEQPPRPEELDDSTDVPLIEKILTRVSRQSVWSAEEDRLLMMCDTASVPLRHIPQIIPGKSIAEIKARQAELVFLIEKLKSVHPDVNAEESAVEALGLLQSVTNQMAESTGVNSPLRSRMVGAATIHDDSQEPLVSQVESVPVPPAMSAATASATGRTTTHWTVDEDLRLVDMLHFYDNNFSEVASRLEGRSDSSVRQRYQALQEKHGALAPRPEEWIVCTRCQKRRFLPGWETPESFGDDWTCENSPWAKSSLSCSDAEDPRTHAVDTDRFPGRAWSPEEELELVNAHRTCEGEMSEIEKRAHHLLRGRSKFLVQARCGLLLRQNRMIGSHNELSLLDQQFRFNASTIGRQARWSPEEDRQLLDLLEEFGKFGLVAKRLSGRTEASVVLRFWFLTRNSGIKDNVEDLWVQCEKPSCSKWRRVPPWIEVTELGDGWTCENNTWDASVASCSASEETFTEKDGEESPIHEEVLDDDTSDEDDDDNDRDHRSNANKFVGSSREAERNRARLNLQPGARTSTSWSVDEDNLVLELHRRCKGDWNQIQPLARQCLADRSESAVRTRLQRLLLQKKNAKMGDSQGASSSAHQRKPPQQQRSQSNNSDESSSDSDSDDVPMRMLQSNARGGNGSAPLPPYPPPTGGGRRWSDREDALLIELLRRAQQNGGTNPNMWVKISTHFRNRTPHACQHRDRQLRRSGGITADGDKVRASPTVISNSSSVSANVSPSATGGSSKSNVNNNTSSSSGSAAATTAAAADSAAWSTGVRATRLAVSRSGPAPTVPDANLSAMETLRNASRKWTRDEEELLINCFEKCGGNLPEIIKALPERSDRAITTRLAVIYGAGAMSTTLAELQAEGWTETWKPEEIAALAILHEKHSGQWPAIELEIPQELPNRPLRAVRRQLYRSGLQVNDEAAFETDEQKSSAGQQSRSRSSGGGSSAKSSKPVKSEEGGSGKWSTDEEKTLLELLERGLEWAKIAEALPGRTIGACQHHERLMRRSARTSSDGDAPRASPSTSRRGTDSMGEEIERIPRAVWTKEEEMELMELFESGATLDVLVPRFSRHSALSIRAWLHLIYGSEINPPSTDDSQLMESEQAPNESTEESSAADPAVISHTTDTPATDLDVQGGLSTNVTANESMEMETLPEPSGEVSEVSVEDAAAALPTQIAETTAVEDGTEIGEVSHASPPAETEPGDEAHATVDQEMSEVTQEEPVGESQDVPMGESGEEVLQELAPSQPERPWDEWDDDEVKVLMTAHCDCGGKWPLIAPIIEAQLPHRLPRASRGKLYRIGLWCYEEHPDWGRKWTEIEDNLLLDLGAFFEWNMQLVSQRLPGRSLSGCNQRERYLRNLELGTNERSSDAPKSAAAPSPSPSPAPSSGGSSKILRKWSEEELTLLIRLHTDCEGNIAEISSHMPDRTESAIRNRLSQMHHKEGGIPVAPPLNFPVAATTSEDTRTQKWSDEELQVLEDLHRQCNGIWKLMEPQLPILLPGRSTSAVRRRLYRHGFVLQEDDFMGQVYGRPKTRESDTNAESSKSKSKSKKSKSAPSNSATSSSPAPPSELSASDKKRGHNAQSRWTDADHTLLRQLHSDCAGAWSQIEPKIPEYFPGRSAKSIRRRMFHCGLSFSDDAGDSDDETKDEPNSKETKRGKPEDETRNDSKSKKRRESTDDTDAPATSTESNGDEEMEDAADSNVKNSQKDTSSSVPPPPPPPPPPPKAEVEGPIIKLGGRRWTEAEEDKLREMVEKYGSDWAVLRDVVVYADFGHRSDSAIRKKVREVSNSSVAAADDSSVGTPARKRESVESSDREGREREAKKRAIVSISGDEPTAPPAQSPKKATGSQEVSSRWTPEEDKKLVELHTKHEGSWPLISASLRGRTVQACQSRLRYIQRGRLTSEWEKLFPKSQSGTGSASSSAAPTPTQIQSSSGMPPPPTRGRSSLESKLEGEGSSDVSAFMHAVKHGDIAFVKQALAKGIQHTEDFQQLLGKTRNAKANVIRQRSPLHCAAERGDAAITKALLGAGFFPDCKLTNPRSNQNTPLDMCGKSGSAEVAALLIKANASVDTADYAGAHPLATAAADGQVGVVRVLVKNRARVDAQDINGYTALHWAADFGHADVVSVLLEAKASVTLVDKEGNTALHWAGHSGDDDVVDSLLQQKSDVSSINKKHETVLHIAAAHGHDNLIPRLIKAGSNPLAKNDKGKTALECCEKGDTETRAALLAAQESATKKRKSVP